MNDGGFVICNGMFDSTPENPASAINQIVDRVLRKALPPSSRAEACPSRVLSELQSIVPVERYGVNPRRASAVGFNALFDGCLPRRSAPSHRGQEEIDAPVAGQSRL